MYASNGVTLVPSLLSQAPPRAPHDALHSEPDDDADDPLRTYLREIHEDDPVRVTFQLLDFDSKRVHYFQQLFHATEGWMSATSENMTLHVDMAAKKVVPFPDSALRMLGRMKASHARLPRPEAAGRAIAMPARS